MKTIVYSKQLFTKTRTAVVIKGMFYVVSLAILVGLITRVALLFSSQTLIAFTFTDWLQIFVLGAVNDISIAIIGLVFYWFITLTQGTKKYQRPWSYLLLLFYGFTFLYLLLFNSALHEFNKSVARILCYFFLYKTISFSVRLFLPQVRKVWTYFVFLLTLLLYTSVLFLNAIGEYFFWDEFGVRYNFIAVDYLVYTNEVIGNIFESYPIMPLLFALFVLSAGLIYLIIRKDYASITESSPLFSRIKLSLVYWVVVALAVVVVRYTTHFQENDNIYVNEFQANGAYKFVTAFQSSALDYDAFYTHYPSDELIHTINTHYNSRGKKNLHTLKGDGAEIDKNIVLITVESLSAEYLSYFGNTDNITPYLDKILDKSMAFTHLFATGNRTVRGLEALSLSLPPSPGESIIKRPNNNDLFSVSTVLKDKNYTVQFIYGGDSYFDNMYAFFSGNGYEVIDRKNIAKDSITYGNIWGVCDEDLYHKALQVFDANAKKQKPFFAHLMTVSNHRPFTYPEGKVRIPPSEKSRKGAVLYTDYALGEFLQAAESHSWFDNTIFVIVADHSASSAGKTEIPLDKYHIPCLIYAPNFIEPQKVPILSSQIDIIPTLFGQLHFTYDSQFYGEDIFSPTYSPRAFVATYQDLGYWKHNILTVLSPVKKVKQFSVREEGQEYNLIPIQSLKSEYIKESVAYYGTVKFHNKEAE